MFATYQGDVKQRLKNMIFDDSPDHLDQCRCPFLLWNAALPDMTLLRYSHTLLIRALILSDHPGLSSAVP